MITNEEFAALVRLCPKTLNEFSEALGVDAANLRHALAGKRNLPSEWKRHILKIMGLDEEGRPDPDQVLFWLLKGKGGTLFDLVKMIPVLFPDGVEVALILPHGVGVHNPQRTDSIWAFTDHALRLVVRQPASPSVLLSSFDFEEDIPGTKIKDGKWATGGRLETRNYSAWQAGQITPKEFDAVWRGEASYTWDDVRDLVMRRHLTPSRVAEMILNLPER